MDVLYEHTAYLIGEMHYILKAVIEIKRTTEDDTNLGVILYLYQGE
jgi:hypothetical protein